MSTALSRPEPGTKTVRQIRIPICRKCGCVIELGMCSDDCTSDDHHDHAETLFYAVWERTDVFLRDEEPK